jgi:ubiquinone/menaquinone biosynthesis C-methylase UbiE
VLDVGAGGGKLTLHVAEQRPDVSVIGLDLSPQQVARGRRAAATFGDRVRFVEGSALDLPFPDASFDGVLCCGSIKHWPDRSRGVAECVRALVPGGRLLLTEADRSCTHEDASAFVAEWPIPGPLEPVFLALFRTWVCGQSIDLDDARRLAAEVGLARAVVERVPRSPLVALAGFREHAIDR